MKLGRYEALFKLGEGGMAKVFLAHQRGAADFSRLVVLKCLRFEHLNNQEMRDSFMQEALLGAQLNHPNLVRTTEVIETEDAPVIVLEHVDGLALSQIFRPDKEDSYSQNKRLDFVSPCKELPLPFVAFVIAELLSALHYFHNFKNTAGESLHLIHRDVSPHNVMVDFEGVVKLLDLGVSKSLDSSSNLTQTGVFKGKLNYGAPEQFFPEQVDTRSDLFAVGIMLYEMIFATRYWGARTEPEIIRQLLGADLPALPELPAGYPPALKAVLERALAPISDDRYNTADEMRRELLTACSANQGSDSRLFVKEFLSEHFKTAREEQLKRIAETMEQSSVKEGGFHSESLFPPELRARTGTGTTKLDSLPSRFALNHKENRRKLLGYSLAAFALGIGVVISTLLYMGRDVNTKSSDASSPIASSQEELVEPSAQKKQSLEGNSASGENLQDKLEMKAPSCASEEILADFEEGYPGLCQSGVRQGIPAFFTDGTGKVEPRPGLLNSSVKLETPRGDSQYALRFRGEKLTDWGAGFAIPLAGGKSHDLSRYQGITLWMKAAKLGTKVMVKFAVPSTLDKSYGGNCSPKGNLGCDDHYGAERQLTDLWVRYRVLFSELKQAGYGIVAQFDQSQALELHLTFPVDTGTPLDFDVEVDDIRLLAF